MFEWGNPIEVIASYLLVTKNLNGTLHTNSALES